MIDWDLKLIILCYLLFFLFVYTIADWNKRKYVFILFLIGLFSESGFNYHLQVSDSVIPTSFSEAVYFLLLLIMGLAWVWQRKAISLIGLERPIRVYLLFALVGVFTAIYFDVNFVNIIIEVKSYVVYIFYLYLIPFLLNKKEDVTRSLWALIILSLVPLLYVLPNLHGLSALEHERVQFTQYWGPLNVFVGYISPVTFIAIALYLTTTRLILKASLLVFIIFSLYVLFYSETRGAWGSVFISFLLFTFLSKKKIHLGVALVMLAALIFYTGSIEKMKSIIEHRIGEETIESMDSSLKNRIDRWDSAQNIFKAHPLTGNGWGGNLMMLKDGKVSEVSSRYLPAWHNSFLEILSQLGIFGALAFFWIWYRIFKLSYTAWRESNDSKDRLILAGLISAVLFMFLYSFGEQQFYRIETASVSWFIIGLLMFYAKSVRSPVLRPPSVVRLRQLWRRRTGGSRVAGPGRSQI